MSGPESAALASLVPSMRGPAWKLIEYAVTLGHDVGVTDTRRTCNEQNLLKAESPDKTKARGCVSWHVHGRAIDLMLDSYKAPPAAYAKLGAFWQSLGGKWGGDFGDPGHFEWREGQTIEELCPGMGSEPCPAGELGTVPLAPPPRFWSVDPNGAAAPPRTLTRALLAAASPFVFAGLVEGARRLRVRPKPWHPAAFAVASVAPLGVVLGLQALGKR